VIDSQLYAFIVEGSNIFSFAFDLKTKRIIFFALANYLKNKLMQYNMQKIFSQFIGSILVISVILCSSDASAESARSLVESGNEAFSRGDYADSLDKYERASESGSDSAIILFNKGDALYRQDKFSEAFNVFEQSAVKAMENNDQALEAKSRYNMGNSAFRRAEELRRQNPQMAFEEYKRSSGYYQAALNLDPNFTEAAHNLEVSRITAKQIEDFIRQQQQQTQQQAQQKQDIASALERLQQEQQDAAEQSKEPAQTQQQQSAGNDPVQQAENQKAITDRTRQTEEKLDQLRQEQDSQFSKEMVQEHVKKAIENQEEAAKKLLENELSEAHENQRDAAMELQKALQRLMQTQDEEPKNANSNQEQQSQNAEAEQLKQQASEEEAGETGSKSPAGAESFSGESPDDIINEEIENRKYRSARGATGYKPVDKDW